MSEFDEEYESFDLRTAEGRARAARNGGGQAGESVDDYTEDLDDEFEDDLDDDDDDDDEDFDDDDDFDDDEDDDDLEDATADDIDLVIAAYREDGQPMAQALQRDLANDLDELIMQLRRLPGDAGAIGFVSLIGEVFCIVRVRGGNVQALVSDASAAGDWPIARDIADFLGIDDIPDPDDDEDAGPMGDLGLLADAGISEFELEAICDNFDDSADELVLQIADKLNVGPAFKKAYDSFDD